jgi:hypothetical protein
MVRNILHYRASGLYPSSGILKNTMFWKLHPFSSSDEELGLLVRTNLNHWDTQNLHYLQTAFLLFFLHSSFLPF